MQVRYVDEYGSGLYWGQTAQPIAPVIGDTVIIDDEEWFVIGRTFYPTQDVIIVTLSDNLPRAKSQKSGSNDRLTEVKNAIVGIKSKQESQDKQTRMLSEEIITIRKYLNNKKGKE